MTHRFEFSKVLAVGIGILFAAAVCFCAVTWVLFGDLPKDIMDYVDGPFMLVVTGYMAKAGVENVTKIRGDTESTQARSSQKQRFNTQEQQDI